MNIKHALLILAISASSPAAMAARTAVPTVLQTGTFQGSTYMLLSESSWPNAEAVAQSLGGHLVTVETAAEDAYIFNTFSPLVSSLANSGVVSLWIGLNDVSVEGTYQWSSGSNAAYRNWYVTEPAHNFADEDYIGIVVSGYGTPGKWGDIVLDERFGDRTFGVVEISPVPELPTHASLLVGLFATGFFFKNRQLHAKSAR